MSSISSIYETYLEKKGTEPRDATELRAFARTVGQTIKYTDAKQIIKEKASSTTKQKYTQHETHVLPVLVTLQNKTAEMRNINDSKSPPTTAINIHSSVTSSVSGIQATEDIKPQTPSITTSASFVQLKERCRMEGLSTNGTKRNLTERLRQHTNKTKALQHNTKKHRKSSQATIIRPSVTNSVLEIVAETTTVKNKVNDTSSAKIQHMEHTAITAFKRNKSNKHEPHRNDIRITDKTTATNIQKAVKPALKQAASRVATSISYKRYTASTERKYTYDRKYLLPRQPKIKPLPPTPAKCKRYNAHDQHQSQGRPRSAKPINDDPPIITGRIKSEAETNDQSLIIPPNDINENEANRLNTELTDDKRIIIELKQQLNIFKKENKDLKSEITDLKQSLETRENDNDTLQNRIKTLETLQQTKDAENTRIKTDGIQDETNGNVAKYGLKAKKEVAVSNGIKMKRLHWNTVPMKLVKGSIWETFDESVICYNKEAFESHFRVRHRQAMDDTKKHINWRNIPQKRRSTVLIGLKKLKLSNEELRRALLEMDESVMNVDTLSKLLEIAPTLDEQTEAEKAIMQKGTQIPTNDDTVTVQQFFFTLCDFDNLHQRLKLWIFKQNFDDICDRLMNKYECIRKACDVITNNKSLQLLLTIVLTFGNHMNSGTSKGQQYGFDLNILTGMKDVKSYDNSQSLLMYIYEFCEVAYASEIRGVLPEVMSIVKTASSMEIETLKEAYYNVQNNMNDIYNLITSDESENYRIDDDFIIELTKFYKKAMLKMKKFRMAISDVMISTKRVMKKWCYGTEADPQSIDSFFQIWWKFIQDFDDAKQRNERMLEVDMRKRLRASLFSHVPKKSFITHNKTMSAPIYQVEHIKALEEVRKECSLITLNYNQFGLKDIPESPMDVSFKILPDDK